VEAALASTASAVATEGAVTFARPSEPTPPAPAESPQQPPAPAPAPAPAPIAQNDSTPTTSGSSADSSGLELHSEPIAEQETDEHTGGDEEITAAADLAGAGSPKEAAHANEEAIGSDGALAEEEATAQNSAGVWTLAEQQLLEQALVKYAPWMEKHKRWRKIAGAVPSKTKSQCTARYAQLRARIYRERGLVRSKHAVATGPVSEDPYMSADMPDAADVSPQSAGGELAKGGADQASTQAGASVDWTVEQQSALDEALAKFPATMDKKERWQSIAKAVPGRSLKECVARFKHLRDQIRQQHDQQEPPAETRHDTGASAASGPGGAEVGQEEGAAALPDLNPEHRGVRAILTDLHLMHVGWSYTKAMSLECSCMDCGHNVVAEVSAGQEWKDWCSSCGTMLTVQLNAAMLHGESGGVAGYFDLAHVIVQDLTQATFCLGCFECGSALTTPAVQRARPLERNCHNCHSKLRIAYQGWRTEDLRASNLDAKPWLKFQVSKARGPVRDPRIVPGKPLPDEGTCKHYAKSHRWLRFPCCGRAFPCDLCHETESECGETPWATRQICGYCAHEQPYSATKPCLKCGQQIGTPRKTRHWEGGKGCRDKALMSNKDSRKFTNSKLKTQSRKADRVGPKQQQQQQHQSHASS